jgi:hypothetical protein
MPCGVTTPPHFLFIPMPSASSPRTRIAALRRFGRASTSFARIMKSIDVIRLVVDGEHCVAILNIDTVFGPVPFAEHIHVANGEISCF